MEPLKFCLTYYRWVIITSGIGSFSTVSAGVTSRRPDGTLCLYCDFVLFFQYAYALVFDIDGGIYIPVVDHTALGTLPFSDREGFDLRILVSALTAQLA